MLFAYSAFLTQEAQHIFLDIFSQFEQLRLLQHTLVSCLISQISLTGTLHLQRQSIFSACHESNVTNLQMSSVAHLGILPLHDKVIATTMTNIFDGPVQPSQIQTSSRQSSKKPFYA